MAVNFARLPERGSPPISEACCACPMINAADLRRALPPQRRAAGRRCGAVQLPGSIPTPPVTARSMLQSGSAMATIIILVIVGLVVLVPVFAIAWTLRGEAARYLPPPERKRQP